MKKLLLLVGLIFILNSCSSPKGTFKSHNIPSEGGYGTINFVGNKLTGTFSKDLKTCMNCVEEEQLKTNGVIITGKFKGNKKMIDNKWIDDGIQLVEINVEYINNFSENTIYKGKSNFMGSSDEILFNEVIYDGSTYMIEETNNLVEALNKTKELKSIKYNKNKCSKMGFEENSDAMGNCVLQLSMKDEELAEAQKKQEIQNQIVKEQINRQNEAAVDQFLIDLGNIFGGTQSQTRRTIPSGTICNLATWKVVSNAKICSYYCPSGNYAMQLRNYEVCPQQVRR